MKAITKVCLTSALSVMLVGYGFSQAAASASKEVTPPPSDQEIPEQSLYADEPLGTDLLLQYGLKLPYSIDMKIAAGDIDGAWQEFENFKKDLGKDQRGQILEAEIMLCNKFIIEGIDRDKWIAKREEAQKAMLSEFPKWSETYNSLINPDATPAQIIEYTTKALQYNPKDYRTYERRGRAYIQMGRISQGCADFEKCPDKDKILEYTYHCKKQN